jgi:anti-sigma B factor antagonist
MCVPAQFHVCTESGEARVVVRGEIDLAVAPAFRDALSVAIRSDCPRVLVHLSEVTFMDSSGAKALVNARRHTDRAGVELFLVAPPRPVRRLLDVLGVWSEFRVEGRA